MYGATPKPSPVVWRIFLYLGERFHCISFLGLFVVVVTPFNSQAWFICSWFWGLHFTNCENRMQPPLLAVVKLKVREIAAIMLMLILTIAAKLSFSGFANYSFTLPTMIHLFYNYYLV